MLEYVPIPLLSLLFPVTERPQRRTQPMQVLCLGLGRTGTDSLRTALQAIGYENVHHGFKLPESPEEGPQWYRLALAKYKDNKESFLNAAEFDKVLGECSAVTDLPSAAFAVELLRAYPNAKVVLNRRRDVQAWCQSQVETIDRLYKSPWDWISLGFDSELFWIARTTCVSSFARSRGLNSFQLTSTLRSVWCAHRLSNFDFAANGENLYRFHYLALEAECRRQNRPWLDWTVEDGWAPLCLFLDKPVPAMEFPIANEREGFGQRMIQVHVKRMARVQTKMAVTGIVLVAGVALGVARWMSLL